MILYQDAALVVVNKPAGLSSEAGLPARLRELWGQPDAYVGIVHRLDTGVSGLMVCARTPKAAAALTRQITQSQEAYAVLDGRAAPAQNTLPAPVFTKQYRAVLAGAPDETLPEHGILWDYLFKDSRKGRVFPVKRPRKGVREAVLEYRIVELLARTPGKVLTHDYIISSVWGPYAPSNNNLILRVNIANIRRKIEKNHNTPRYILAEIGVGYRMADAESLSGPKEKMDS